MFVSLHVRCKSLLGAEQFLAETPCRNWYRMLGRSFARRTSSRVAACFRDNTCSAVSHPAKVCVYNLSRKGCASFVAN